MQTRNDYYSDLDNFSLSSNWNNNSPISDSSDSSFISHVSEEVNIMSASGSSSPGSTVSVNDITNLFANKIDLKDKTGVLLYREACKGLPDKEKFALTLTNAQAFKDQVDRAAAEFCWGPVCSEINDTDGNPQDLLTDII